MTKPPEKPRTEEETALRRDLTTDVELRGVAVLSWRDFAGEHMTRVERRMTLGSASENGIVIADPTVSRLHGEIEVRPEGLWLRDLGSRNGTFVEGVQIESARIPRTGARLQVGSTRMKAEFVEVQAPLDVWRGNEFGPLVGRSKAMRQLFATLARVSRTESSVLIHGETGTGKELAARAIHDASSRANGPFVVVDCGALPESLLDAELFGHAKGAFTGATSARAGAIESAENGTVFLDEIGELHLSVQPKLLRALESRTVRRIGESTHRRVNVRFISATHRDLLKMTSAGEFREDLYFRLAVVPIHVPPLRQRLEDIEALVARFLPEDAPRMSPEIVAAMTARPWRGNVRELRNFVERFEALGEAQALALMSAEGGAALAGEGAWDAAAGPASVRDGKMSFDDLPVRVKQGYRHFREQWIDFGERAYVTKLLERHAGNVAAAATEAGLDRTYLYRLIRKHSL